MQDMKIYLDEAVKSFEKMKEHFQSKNVECEVIKNDFEKIPEYKFDNYSIILMSIAEIDYYDKYKVHEILNTIHEIPVIFLYQSANKALINKISNLTNVFIYKENGDFVQLLNYTKYCHQKQNSINMFINENIKEIHQLQYYKNLFNATYDGIISIDDSNKAELINKQAAKMFTLKKGDNIDSIISEDMQTKFRNLLSEFRASNDKSFKIESKGVHKIGLIIPIEITFLKFKMFESSNFTLIINDITEKVEANNEIENLIEEMQISREIIEQSASEQVMLNSKLYEQQEELELLNASKDKFFSIIAHDLKNPFQTLLGYSEVLSKDINELEKKDIELFAKNLNNSAQKLFKLLENLLHWSRIQRGAITYTPETVDLYLISELNIDLVAFRVNEKGITLTNKVIPGTECYADPNMLDTIIRNLISNAIKFTPKGGKIELHSELNSNHVLYSVSDTGVGMTDEVMQKIFRIDKHHTTQGTDKEEGTGLGLILCHDLAQKNNGSLSVKSQIGLGSTFTVKIPTK